MSGPSGSQSTSADAGLDRSMFEPSDEQLMYWQERQIAKCIFDNTVNRVVESYLTFFEEEGDGERRHGDDAFPDIADPMPNRTAEDSERLEESAVLWAIDEHGLHHIGGSPPSLSSSSSSSSSTESNMRLLYAPPDQRISSDSSDSDEPLQIIKPINMNMHLLPELDSANVEPDELPNPANENEHIDFMEAAVAVAIQKKGISIQTSPNR